MSHRQNFSTPFVATCFCDFIPVAFPNIARGRQSNPLGTQMLIAYSPARYIILSQRQWCLWKHVVFILHPRWGKSLELLLSSYLIWVFQLWHSPNVPLCPSQDAWGQLGYPKHDYGRKHATTSRNLCILFSWQAISFRHHLFQISHLLRQ